MKKYLANVSKSLLLGLSLAVPVFTTAQADDTEVYFLDSQITNRPTPKILIGVDYSSAGNGGKVIENFKAAMKAIATDDSINADADLGFAVVGKDGDTVTPIIYPAKPYDAPLDPSFDEAVEILGTNILSGNTPTIQGLSELSRYFMGKVPKYDSYATPSTHPDAIFDGRYIGNTDAACNNTMVIIGTGQDNSTSWKDVDEIVSSNYCTGNDCDGSHLTAYMREVNNTITYTIDAGAKGKNAVNLDNWAFAGGTDRAIDYDPVNDTGDCTQETSLCYILKSIIKDVASQSSSFVQAGVTVSQQNRLNHDDHLYFAQFQASSIARWPGNLKKYKITDSQIVDVNGDPAVDSETGLFVEERTIDKEIISAVSFWPKNVDGVEQHIPDGNQVALGGALEQLDQFLTTRELTADDGTTYNVFESYSRNLYTTQGGATVPFSHDVNTFPTEGDFNFVASDPDKDDSQEFEELKARAFGFTLREVPEVTHSTTDPDTGETTTTTETIEVASPARLMGDPLHSTPKVLQYTDGTSLSFIGTNLGYLHAINMSNGHEAWSFLPYSMLSKMEEYLSSISIGGDPTKHNYGLDGEIFIAHADTNGNLKVDSDEKALLVVGMRRGGDKYFVIDVSDPTKPEFKFELNSSSPGLDKLGDTWSTPLITNIDYYDTASEEVVNKTVLIFGGGYDKDVDYVFDAPEGENLFDGTIDEGNDVFIYDLSNPNGENAVLWKFSTSGIDANISSVPANVRAISLDNDGTVDHLYAATVDGKVYRMDLTPDEVNGGFNVKGGKIFDANSGVTNEQAKVRFYNAPSVAFIPRPNRESFVAVALGSGYRAHPLNATINDKFYMIRDKGVLKREKTFGKGVDATDTNNPIVLDDLVEASVISSDGPNEVLSAQEGGDSLGWYINLTGITIDGVHYDGEKVITEARILFGKIVFTSYIPTFDVGGTLCSPVIGSGKLYGVNVIDGTSFFSDTTRTIELISDGIPPLFQLLYTAGAGADGAAGFISLVGNEVIDGEFTKALTKGYDGVIRVNWRKKPDDEM